MGATVVSLSGTLPQARPRACLYLRAYGLLLTALLIVAVVVALAPPVRQALHALVPLSWHTRPHDPDAHNLQAAWSLFEHNARLMLAPLALAAAIGHRPGRLRTALDVLLAALVAANTLPVAVALGSWGQALLPYVPNAPFELAALTVGPLAWLEVTRGRMRVARLWLPAVAILGLLTVAAALETWAVP